MPRKSGIVWIILLLSMSSCVTYEKFSIEVLKPAKILLPPDFHNVVIASRNLKYNNDTLQNYHLDHHHLIKDRKTFNSDSLAIQVCLDSLMNQLVIHSRFDSLLVLPVSLFQQRRVKDVKADRAEWYKNVADENNADGLILLDMFSCFYSNLEEYDSSPLVNVVTSNIWSIYDAHEHKIINRYAQIDTLYWDGRDENGRLNRAKIPAKKDAITIAAGVIGKNYSKLLISSWTPVYRDIMNCNQPELNQATKLAQKNKWDEASGIWQKYKDDKNTRNKIVALYNLTLAAEMTGDIDMALEIATQAAKASSGAFFNDENKAIRKYSVVLFQRKVEINKLDTQHELH